MSLEETINILEIAKAEVEWNYPLNYYIAIEKAIGILKDVKSMIDKEIYDIGVKDNTDA